MENKTGIELIAQEREEQIEKHGRNIDYDKEFHKECQIKFAALYALGYKGPLQPYGGWEDFTRLPIKKAPFTWAFRQGMNLL